MKVGFTILILCAMTSLCEARGFARRVVSGCVNGTCNVQRTLEVKKDVGIIEKKVTKEIKSPSVVKRVEKKVEVKIEAPKPL